MRIFNPKVTKRNVKSKPSTLIKRILNSPKGPNLRSRKIKYAQEQILEQEDDYQQDINSNLKTTQQKTQKHDNHQEKQESKQKVPINQSILDKEKQQDDNDCQQLLFEEKQHNQEDFSTPVKRKKRQCRPFPLKRIFESNQFKKIQEIDFLLYFRILSKAKMFSTLLINEFGQVIFADRLGSQHFEGSLNNFARNPIYSMILDCERLNFFEKASQLREAESIIMKLLIYSKNSKRRYSKSSNQISLTNQDIFNRYLKCISCQIFPIQITITSTDQFEGFWNRKLFDVNQPFKCFLFKSRLSKTLPDLADLNLMQDRKIEKFLKYTRRKQAEMDETVMVKKQSEIDDKQNVNSHNDIQSYFLDDFLNEKDIEHIYSQMNEDIKHSKSNLTKSCALNSGEGKPRHQRK